MDFTPFIHSIRQVPREGGICNLIGSAAGLFFALHDDPFLVLERTEETAQDLRRDVNFYREALQRDPLWHLPEPDGAVRAGERAQMMAMLTADRSLVSSFRNLRLPLRPPSDAQNTVLRVTTGSIMERDDLEAHLEKLGYQRASLVTEQGEYCRRAWIIDVFPSTGETPIRLEFFGDVIESLKTFDVETQRSLAETSNCVLYPATEPSSGITLLDVMGAAPCYISDEIPEKGDLPRGALLFSRYGIEGLGHRAEILPLNGYGLLREERANLGQLPQKIKSLSKEHRFILVASSESQAEKLKETFRDEGMIAPVIGRRDIFSFGGNVCITVGALSSGLHMGSLFILTENELFGKRPPFRPLRRSKVSGLLNALDDLRPGDYVVHRDHGIGIFQGLVTQMVEGSQEDLITIEYADGKLYLPIQRITKITKYHAEEGASPRVDRLGGKNWQRTKQRIEKNLKEMAEKLIALHARRAVHKGFAFSPDTDLHRDFESFFPYEETPDQIKATREIKQDMESEKPMDRLLCGDVGYGKTEVAIKAAFKAVYDGFQVAVLVPTTILCEQHYRTFSARFSAFPVRIDYLSRFKTGKRFTETVQAIASGDIDIVIGTHCLLGKNISFHKLGLLIIDEEHRFGVAQKEKMKELKTGIDVLTLTATPIPRTLSMALSGIRDMSVIETPPEERVAVKTVVSRFDKHLIRDAIERERERKGQVFFVHNRIQDIHKIAEFVQKLVPAARIAVAHGRMLERQLERVMLDFYQQNTDVLVSTAIIGSGLDVPSANTIIINRADTMGLADLYQLKGRVGRSYVRAFAYFLITGESVLTEEAKMRLQAIQEMSYLGAGFRLALKDLEIRGAGNLLGAEQAGHIHEIGFDLYMELLEKAVAECKGQPIADELEPAIQLKTDAFIPEEYISDMTLRLSIYRKIASAKTPESLDEIVRELRDRFGTVPAPTINLIDIMRLKMTAKDLMIAKIQDRDGIVHFAFSSQTKIEPRDILALGREFRGLRFHPDGFDLNLGGLSWERTYEKISEILVRLKRSCALLVN